MGGKVSKGVCKCGSKRERVKIGKNAFARQIKRQYEPIQNRRKAHSAKAGEPELEEEQLTCRRGTVRGGKCHCTNIYQVANKQGPRKSVLRGENSAQTGRCRQGRPFEFRMKAGEEI